MISSLDFELPIVRGGFDDRQSAVLLVVKVEIELLAPGQRILVGQRIDR